LRSCPACLGVPPPPTPPFSFLLRVYPDPQRHLIIAQRLSLSPFFSTFLNDFLGGNVLIYQVVFSLSRRHPLAPPRRLIMGAVVLSPLLGDSSSLVFSGPVKERLHDDRPLRFRNLVLPFESLWKAMDRFSNFTCLPNLTHPTPVALALMDIWL